MALLALIISILALIVSISKRDSNNLERRITLLEGTVAKLWQLLLKAAKKKTGGGKECHQP